MSQAKEKIIYKVSDIAIHLGGQLIGDGDMTISTICSLDQPKPNAIAYLSGDLKYANAAIDPSIQVLLLPESQKHKGDLTIIKVSDNSIALEKLKDLLYPITLDDRQEQSEHSYRQGQFCAIDSTAKIGSDTILGNQVVIGPNVTIGRNCNIADGVKIYAASQIGSNVVIKANTIIGGEGFGFYYDQGYKKIRHVGSVRIEDDVHIGSNCCIDQGTINNTIIRRGAKLDNLIQVAHNVEIGRDVAIAAQTGISGSAVIGDGVQLGGQVGVIGHVRIAPGSRIQAQSGVAGNIIEGNQKWYGYPAVKYWDYLRSFALFKRLPSLERRLSSLEELVTDKSKSSKDEQ